MTRLADLLAAYDEQLRTDAETPSAVSVSRHGPLRLVTFAGGRGFVTYQNLGGADADEVRRLVPEALAHYEADATVETVEWKTRGHDDAPGLHEALLDNGFSAQKSESIMIGTHGLCGATGAGAWERLRGDLGRCDPPPMEGMWDLPRPDRSTCPLGDRDGQDTDPQRLDRRLAPHPGTRRAGQGFCNDAVSLVPLNVGHVRSTSLTCGGWRADAVR